MQPTRSFVVFALAIAAGARDGRTSDQVQLSDLGEVDIAPVVSTAYLDSGLAPRLHTHVLRSFTHALHTNDPGFS